MNSWKLNSTIGHHARVAVCRDLNISHSNIYKTVKDIDHTGIIKTKDGKKYKLKLEEI
jgi:predicted transcriptional regulator|tara:strand:- start:2180 stop:2353 length:174 start_codon:yes stop_codon:yes gene_type:complete